MHMLIPSARWRLMYLSAAAILIIAFLHSWNSIPTGSVMLLVREEDAERSVFNMSVGTGVLQQHTDVDVSSYMPDISRTYPLSDGSIITLEPAGIVRTSQGVTTVLVASPVPPSVRSSLSVAGDGARIAWINPADNSVQVFMRTDRGSYAPLYVDMSMASNSVGLTPDGTILVVAKMHDAETALYRVTLSSGERTVLRTISGFATIVPAL